MSVFKLDKGNITIDMEIVANTPPYLALWKSDTSEGKETAISKFRLIYHMLNRNSQYSTSFTGTRLPKIIADLFPMLDKWQAKADKDKHYQAAFKQYEVELDLIPEYALLDAAQDAVHDLAVKIKDPTNKNKTDDLGKMRKAMEDLQVVQQIVKEKHEQAQAIKGKHALKKREDPEYYENKGK